ncbi:hypothetical protein AVEN_75335-1 [Araneus ventricosus]|uniref:Uncharacterized protein n=1 Tax=Araneus ventricosus TaxID=182803 RepID=A0A4Y2SGE9_ARAVE|nr:hypothetical protein AVEN_75335-1 [Araneus ventricosus]
MVCWLTSKTFEVDFELLHVVIGDQDKSWAPHIACQSCCSNMTSWLKGSRDMPFAIPMIWREPKDHSTDYYFCLTDISGITSHSRHTVVYPNLPSAIRPVPRSLELPIPKPPETWSLADDRLICCARSRNTSLPCLKRDVRNDRGTRIRTPSFGREKTINVPRSKGETLPTQLGYENRLVDDNDDTVPDSVVLEEAEDDQNPMYADVQTSPMSHLISQSDLNDLVRDLNLSKNQSELLASRLKE